MSVLPSLTRLSRAIDALRAFKYILFLALTAALTCRIAFAAVLPAPVGLTHFDQFGKLKIVAYPLYISLQFIYIHIVHNWGTSIILFTLAFNTLMIWPRLSSMKSSLQMMRLRPSIDRIRDRYAHLSVTDPRHSQMNREIMALYKTEGASAFGGCLPLLVQMPLLFGFFSVLQNAVELHNAGWGWLIDLAKPDPLHILPAVIILTMTITQFLTPTPGMNPRQRRTMAVVMAVVFGCTLWKYAAGIALYWATGNIVNLFIQVLVNQSAIGMEMQALAKSGPQ